MKRRHFVSHSLKAAAVLTLPTAGCVVAGRGVMEPVATESYLDEFAFDAAEIDGVMSVLGSRGADFGELFVQHRVTDELVLDASEIVDDRRQVLRGAGLRVVRDDTPGFSFTEDLSVNGLMAAARAAAVTTVAGDSAIGNFAQQPLGVAYPVQTHWSSVGKTPRTEMLERIDRVARTSNSAVTGVRVSWLGADEKVLIATLDGALVFDERPMTRLSVAITLTRGKVEHTGFASIAGRAGLDWYTDRRLQNLVATAMSRADQLFDARQPPLGEMPVVLAAGAGGVVLHEAIGHAFEADLVHTGRSPYRDALHHRVAGVDVTVVDDGTRRRERGALNYDDEGEAAQRRVLVERGILRGFLHDRASAKRDGVPPTGSARRATYQHLPLPRMTCTTIESGRAEADELLAEMGRGIVAEGIVGGSVSLADGSYRFSVRHGWLVEKGKRLVPLRDFELVGNGPDTLANIRLVANDFRMDPAGWSCGKQAQRVPVSHGMPSVLVSKLDVDVAS